MQIITVAPIVRGVLKDTLTYFSKDDLEIGTVVMVPIRTREIPAIILETSAVSNAKSTLKSSDYAIRKITKAKPRRIWTPAFLRSAEHTANFSAQKFGETLLALTPKTILDAYLDGGIIEPNISPSGNKFEILAIQGDTKTRLESYRGLVRESFARHESVFICLPTEDDVERVAKMLGHGIEGYTFSFHGRTTKKQLLDRWRKASADKHAVLVVGTAQYLGIPRYFKTIILDEEHARGWKTIMRPLLDLRIFAEEYAKESNSTFIIGAPILRTETFARVKAGTIDEFGRIAMHTLACTETAIINPRLEEEKIRANTGKRRLIVLTTAVRALIEQASAKNERVLLVAARKGLASITACGDCGTLIRCPQCDTPLVVHKKELAGLSSQIFICHACGFMRSPENNVHEVCPRCKGWRLQGIGIGTDLIHQEVASLFPDAPLFALDGDRAKTRTQAKKIINQFEKSKGGILIATPMAITLLDTVEYAVIVSVDSLFSIPDIRMSERIFALVLALREKVLCAFLIQTRADDTTIFKQALKGDLATFTENELTLRKAFAYPPYGTIIKITLRGKRADVASEMERLKIFLNDCSPIIPGTMAREPKNIFRMHMVLKLTEKAWPENKLLAKLRTLPPQFIIEVNPDHLL
ncbi:MAG: hypothetical protein HZB12_02495 [Candidatus Yonathbacteria bacterium]|nr:hypothetical protein [Candidatus Yonathbacteria bacterium]